MWHRLPSKHTSLSFEYWQDKDIFGHDLAAANPWVATEAAGSTAFGLVVHTGAWVISTRDAGFWLYDVPTISYCKVAALSQGQNPVQMMSDTPGVYQFSIRDRATVPPHFLNPRLPGYAKTNLLPAAPPFLTIHTLEWQSPTVCVHVFRDAGGRQSKQNAIDVEPRLNQVNNILAQAMVTTSGKSATYQAPVMNPLRRYAISENLGQIVTHRQPAGNIFDVLAKYIDRTSDVNIFYVWAYKSNSPDFGFGVDSAQRRIIVIQDDPHRPERQLAIAFARLLGVTRPNVFQAVDMRLHLLEIQKVNETAGKITKKP